MREIKEILENWEVHDKYTRSYLEVVKREMELYKFFEGKKWTPTQAQRLALQKLEENGIKGLYKQ